jgi:hypothetical protein
MSDTNTLRHSARPIRRAIILERLRSRIREPKSCFIPGYEEGYSADEEAKLARDEAAAASTQVIPQHANLEKTAAKLTQVCKEEQASASDAERNISNVAAYRKTAAMLPKQEPGMDTSILDRIRSGEGPRDKVFKDLLAPLRLQGQAPDSEESYEDMQKVLLAWNQKVAGNSEDDSEARKAFIAALEKRIKSVERVFAIVRDEKNIDQSDKIGQEGILEPSERRLRQAIHAYRPETRKFKSQDPFDLLVVMWANIGRANPDLNNDDDWMYLTYKVLHGEAELEKRFDREEKRRINGAKKEAAVLKRDAKGVQDCTKQWELYNKSLAKATRQQTIGKLKCARKSLREIVLDEQLELTILQSVQQRAGKEAQPNDFIPRWGERLDKYKEKDVELDGKLERMFPDLESTAESTANQIEVMAMVHTIGFTRAQKITGEDLVGLDEVAKKAVLEARLNDSSTLGTMKLTKDGVLESQRIARQMLKHVGAMEESLSELFEAARTKHEELEVMSLFVDQDGSPCLVGEVEAGETEDLPRGDIMEEVEEFARTEHADEA